MFIEFQINSNLLGHGENSSLLIKPLDRVFQVYYQGLLISTLYKLKGDTWIQVEGSLEDQDIENIGKEIDNKFSIQFDQNPHKI